jgi:hypothetical protein
MKLCEAPIDVLRGAIRSYQQDEHPATGKMNADALLSYMQKHKRARQMLPKVYKDNAEVEIPLSIVRKTILAYRRKHHPAASRMRRAELEAYLKRVKIKPIGKELPKLKRDHCDKPQAPQLRRSKRKQASVADEEAIIAAASELTEPVTGPKKKKKRGRPRKSTLLNTDAGLRAVEQMLPDLEQRAVQMDADDDSLAW